jgi:hypothetical protein
MISATLLSPTMVSASLLEAKCISLYGLSHKAKRGPEEGEER